MKAYFYGDSNTYGYDPRGVMGGRYPAEYRWTDILARNFSDWTIVSDGMNGRCIPSDDQSFQFLEKNLLREGQIDVFAVMLGTNDLLNQWESDPEEIAANMEAFCRKVQSVLNDTAEHAACYIITPPKLVLGGADGEKYNGKMSALCDQYAKVAEEVSWDFIDTRDQNFSMAFDGIHLSEDGHVALAKALADMILRDSHEHTDIRYKEKR